MTYRTQLAGKALGQLKGFPEAAFDALITTLGELVDNPHDPLRTFPTDAPQERQALFGGSGIVTYWIDDARDLITVHDVTWVG